MLSGGRLTEKLRLEMRGSNRAYIKAIVMVLVHIIAVGCNKTIHEHDCDGCDLHFKMSLNIDSIFAGDYYSYDLKGRRQGIYFSFSGEMVILRPYINSVVQGVEIWFLKNKPIMLINNFKGFVVGQRAITSYDSLNNLLIEHLSYCQPYFEKQLGKSVCIV